MVEIGTTDSLNGTSQQRKRRLEILAHLTEQTLWKKRIATDFEVSVQTIGRDVDALHRDGLLTYTLVEPDTSTRTHLVGYTTTDTGGHVLEEYRICRDCGEVVHVDRDCLHSYTPLTTYYGDDGEGGD